MKTGITLYSATNEWVTRRYDLEGLLAAVSERGLGPGVEIVGFQTIPTFPDVTAEFARDWDALIAKYDLVPSCLGSNIDVAQRSDRLLTDDEMVASLERQLEVAHQLGFGVVRIQIGANESVIERGHANGRAARHQDGHGTARAGGCLYARDHEGARRPTTGSGRRTSASSPTSAPPCGPFRRATWPS